MKATLVNVILGAVVLAAILYGLNPSLFVREGFEGSSSIGGILGTVFASILGIGIFAALVGAAMGPSS